jgi:methylglyoxal synthase
VYFYKLHKKAMTKKRIALIAHDNKKRELIEWSKYNRNIMAENLIYATGTTGKMLERELEIEVTCLKSGPLGGDQQIGALIAEGNVDILIFFWDPLEPLPHDPDIKALLRLAVVWNIPFACNRTTADFLFSSPLLFSGYKRKMPDFNDYNNRKIE